MYPSIFVSLDRIWDEINRFFPMSSFVVNIGANDGIKADPLFPLRESHPDIGGVFIKPSDLYFSLAANYERRFPNAQLVHAGVDIYNAAERANGAQKQGAPCPSASSGLDILKLEIDSCECHILEKFIADPFFAAAKVIQIETNHHLLPPLAWQDMCSNGVHGRSGTSPDVWDGSVQSAYDIVKSAGVELLQYDWPDAVFVHHNFLGPCFFV